MLIRFSRSKVKGQLTYIGGGIHFDAVASKFTYFLGFLSVYVISPVAST